ncbi:hypothetical protein GCM10007071_25740 [Marinobacter zhanjiangensis]|uniref:Uncharacterized protein n=1 Tax=Marinobacter zhanjiangensis TaxID=578215 RepID=A0ABQ3B3U1_9GAMM|nr:hypothetical protein GCM10007071_25740 [Marinobacter zhanjiangensis]
MAFGKKVWRIEVEVIAVRSEVVVDNIQEDHDLALVRGLYQVFQLLGPAIGVVWSKEQNAVIAPVSAPRKVR